MFQRPSIADRVGDLIALVTDGLELAVARQVGEMAKADPDLARRLRRRRGPGYRVVPRYDRTWVGNRLDAIDQAHAEGATAFAEAVRQCREMIRALDMARLSNAAAPVECPDLAGHWRAIHSQVLLFNLRTAQVLCAMQEIQGAIVLHHECEPDPCAALPPAREDGQGYGAYAEDEAEEEEGAAPDAERGEAARPAEGRRRGRGTAG